jgi:hypothetical protein
MQLMILSKINRFILIIGLIQFHVLFARKRQIQIILIADGPCHLLGMQINTRSKFYWPTWPPGAATKILTHSVDTINMANFRLNSEKDSVANAPWQQSFLPENLHILICYDMVHKYV